jgi:putative membrane protein
MENTIPDQQLKAEAKAASDFRTDLSIETTILAMERTQLAWVRTVLTFITAGFAIDKGTELLHEARLVSGTAWSKEGHFAGLLLTITATVLMAMETVIYIRRVRQLNKMVVIKIKLPFPTTILSIFICLVGALAINFMKTSW